MKFPIQLILIIIAKKNDLKNQYMKKKWDGMSLRAIFYKFYVLLNGKAKQLNH